MICDAAGGPLSQRGFQELTCAPARLVAVFALAPPAGGCFINIRSLRIWRNWQTRYFEVVVE